MRPPAFWFTHPDQPNWKARALAPLAALVARATRRRVAQPGFRANIPVICVGNLNMGGTGKTPTVIALIERLYAKGIHAHVVSRGYGGRLDGPLQVDPKQHAASDVGDEPLLIAAFGPTWIAKNRADGVRAAQDAGAQVILLDDGFQNPSVVKDLSIVVVDAVAGFGNGRVAPAGPLREPVSTGLARANAVLVIGPPTQRTRFLGIWGGAITQPILGGELVPLRTGMDWTGERVFAFAGIGRPEKFFATLRAMGADVVKTQPLDDHQQLSEALMKRLEIEAFALGAQLVTTEKDAVRLPASFQQRILTVSVRLDIDDWSALDQLLDFAGL